jgi:uncharacterized protein (DUF2147 family)
MQTARSCTLFLVLSVLSATQTLFAQSAAPADAILGNFLDKDNGTTIQVYKVDEQYFGKVAAIGNGDGKAQVGTILLKQLVFSAGEWKGQVYAPKRDKDFPVTVTLPDSTTLQLNVHTPIGSRKIEWKRATQ